MLYICDIHSHSKMVREVLLLTPFCRTCSLSSFPSLTYKCAPLRPLLMTWWIFSTSLCTVAPSPNLQMRKLKLSTVVPFAQVHTLSQWCAKYLDSFCLTWRCGWKLGRSNLDAGSAAGELCVLGRLTWCSCASFLIYKMRVTIATPQRDIVGI